MTPMLLPPPYNRNEPKPLPVTIEGACLLQPFGLVVIDDKYNLAFQFHGETREQLMKFNGYLVQITIQRYKHLTVSDIIAKRFTKILKYLR